MNYRFSKRSLKNLENVHPDLVEVAHLALKKSKYDFGINDSTFRTMVEQERLFLDGKSKTMNSRHVPDNNECCLSCAIDFNVYVNGKINWDIKYFRKVAQAFIDAAIELQVPIALGVLWENFIDGPHVELDRRIYP